jgi:hypothetical protein
VNRVDVLGYFLFGSNRAAKPVLSYSTVEKKLGICGGALWKIRLHVSGATWTRGSIYQQITTKGWAQPCGHATGNKVSLDYPDFTEYWRVESTMKNNQPISTITDSAGGIDLFLAPAQPTCTRGKLTITANAMYADGVVPNAPAAPGNVGQAGKLWAEWGHVYPRNAVAYSAYVKRKWTIKWDCCDCLPQQIEVSYSE